MTDPAVQAAAEALRTWNEGNLGLASDEAYIAASIAVSAARPHIESVCEFGSDENECPMEYAVCLSHYKQATDGMTKRGDRINRLEAALREIACEGNSGPGLITVSMRIARQALAGEGS